MRICLVKLYEYKNIAPLAVHAYMSSKMEESYDEKAPTKPRGCKSDRGSCVYTEKGNAEEYYKLEFSTSKTIQGVFLLNSGWDTQRFDNLQILVGNDAVADRNIPCGSPLTSDERYYGERDCENREGKYVIIRSTSKDRL